VECWVNFGKGHVRGAESEWKQGLQRRQKGVAWKITGSRMIQSTGGRHRKLNEERKISESKVRKDAAGKRALGDSRGLGSSMEKMTSEPVYKKSPLHRH